jgi:hypothetical protein
MMHARNERGKAGFERLLSVMPEGWEEKAKELGDICSISKKAVFTRFQRYGEWLGWLCERLYRNNKATGEAPVWLRERKSDFLFRFGTNRFWTSWLQAEHSKMKVFCFFITL